MTVACIIFQDLLKRVRAEYREMLGLQLTVAQACRLWTLDPETCERVLDTLVREHFLCRRRDGSFICQLDA